MDVNCVSESVDRFFPLFSDAICIMVYVAFLCVLQAALCSLLFGVPSYFGKCAPRNFSSSCELVHFRVFLVGRISWKLFVWEKTFRLINSLVEQIAVGFTLIFVWNSNFRWFFVDFRAEPLVASLEFFEIFCFGKEFRLTFS